MDQVVKGGYGIDTPKSGTRSTHRGQQSALRADRPVRLFGEHPQDCISVFGLARVGGGVVVAVWRRDQRQIEVVDPLAGVVADRAHLGKSQLARLETGQRAPDRTLAARLDDILESRPAGRYPV